MQPTEAEVEAYEAWRDWENVIRTCPNCKTEFEPYNVLNEFCRRSCHHEYHGLDAGHYIPGIRYSDIKSRVRAAPELDVSESTEDDDD